MGLMTPNNAVKALQKDKRYGNSAKNAKPWKDIKMSSLERNELLRTVKRLGTILWKNGQAIIAEVW